MLITSLNSVSFKNVLIAILHADTEHQDSQKKDNIVRIKDRTSDVTLGYNFLKISQTLPELKANGQVLLSADQVARLNDALQAAGFEPELVSDLTPKFVIGHVKTLVEHPDSDHLHIAMVEVDSGTTLQIVCGAPNVAQGQKVVVAKVGAMMPNGQIIWPGELRGVKSDGMISAARELGLPNAPKKRGILVLPTDAPTGAPFDFNKGAAIVAEQND
ncbi:YtpR family tRNA-binding protein [Loigolactobacillus backii]|uniref:tRNA-binding protein n=1 Tax=Loigolactobacillus backii TaxID=375175 RepID=A0A192H411_9LACO|nr:DUF4479 and tRNA-binding domain-containing protein [Loigolactobacillus backii]ANK59293.1 tRNA-binding protein [Loigolactobacillus backii]ANK62706.1 tRNA-binding protein [Loigolactobacillus backii]ANK64285.1 tRNA-binding protein [Loigolactobacillus backii]ANK67321.1 tRNA-binding protein [Loigolactobacillus backii]ANK70286.1 tRNA-binding protein [Loigolactobacillus backii]